MLPIAYTKRMEALLGEEYPRYLEEMEKTPTKALHINRYKACKTPLGERFPGGLTPIPYAEDGYYIEGNLPLGKHPLHHGGAYYMQDPSSMVPVCSADVKEGMRVLDLCAAPGGKSTQLANRIGEGGILVSNEIVPSRCTVLGGNGERMGLTNQIITSTDAPTLGAAYSGFFDVVVVDAPCSGEGMFRKYPEAVGEWSPQNVTACQKRQLEILEGIEGALKPGGELIYSTCTFSLEENEEVVREFLLRHPGYRLLPVPDAVKAVTAPGVLLPEGDCDTVTSIHQHTRRFYPHSGRGEGQFVARFQKGEGDTPKTKQQKKSALKPLSKEEARVFEAFLQETVGDAALLEDAVVLKGNICLVPKGVPVFEGITYGAGVRAGRVEKGRFIPEHWFSMAYGSRFLHKIDFACDDPNLFRYLRGETFPHEGRGWGCVLVDGCPVGLVKISGGVCKNHYPKGLRIRG